MSDWLSRQTMLIGEQATRKLHDARVAVIGLGGVGGAAFEAIVRSGIGHIMVMDYDVFDQSNLNRQILAFQDTVGLAKTHVAALRAAAINPKLTIVAHHEKFCLQNTGLLASFRPDYVIDAIDMVSAKLDLIEWCKNNEVPVISSMGTGNRIDAGCFRIGDIADTTGCGCPLARVMRRELRKRGVADVTVLYGVNAPLPSNSEEGIPGSISCVPPVAGYLIAGHVIRSLLGRGF